MKKFLFTAFMVAASLCAQTPDGQRVVPTDGPGADRYTKLFFTSGNTTFICWSKNVVSPTSRTITTITSANPAVFTSTAHGFNTAINPQVVITGGTGDWVGVNGTFVATIIDANTYSIPVDASAFASFSGSITVTVTAPRTSRAIWSVQRVVTDGTNPLSSSWALGDWGNVCDNRATLAFQ